MLSGTEILPLNVFVGLFWLIMKLKEASNFLSQCNAASHTWQLNFLSRNHESKYSSHYWFVATIFHFHQRRFIIEWFQFKIENQCTSLSQVHISYIN